jgi:hypothetical protein
MPSAGIADLARRSTPSSPISQLFFALPRLPGLNPEQIEGTIAGKPTPTVTIRLPHRMDKKQGVWVFVEQEAVVFSYDGDHMHFGYGEPDAPIEQALDFARDLLDGRVEVEIRGWLLATGVTTYRVGRDGAREKLQSGGYLGWISVPFRRKTRLISFR